MEQNDPLCVLFSPESLAVVGASGTPGKVGRQVLVNLLESGYQGKIFPVNPSGGKILGLESVRSVAGLPEGTQLGIVCVPRESVPQALEDLGLRGARAVIVLTAGFKEVGREGWRLEEEAVAICRRHGMIMLGPNCLGLQNSREGLNATFAGGAAGALSAGDIGFFSQSGALCISILDTARDKGIGFSKFVSLGNKALLGETDMLRFLKDDPGTRVILGYVESIADGQAFLHAAQETTAVKPVIMVKSGVTASGARAASSHTGAMAGSEEAIQAIFAQSGILRTHGVESMLNLALAFATLPLPRGPNLCVVTNSGGPGILAADAADRSSLVMTPLRGKTVGTLKDFLPSHAAFYNPVDIVGDADAARFARALEVVMADPMVHMVLAILTPVPSVDVEAVAHAVARQAQKGDKPVAACFMGAGQVAGAKEILRAARVPCYEYPEQAVEALDGLHRHAQWSMRPLPVHVCYMSNTVMARDILEKAKAKGHTELVEFMAQDVLKAYGLSVPRTILAKTSDEAVKAAKSMGYPVAVKIASPQISHKTDMGGVMVGLANDEDVRQAFLAITNRAKRARDVYILGCLVQKMAPKGSREVFAGFRRDPQYGAIIVFGLGGIYVEVLRDISCRIAPLSLTDVAEMVREIKSYPILRGVRGEPGVDVKALEDVLLSVSQIAMDFPEIVECDLNPVMAGPQGALVVDARFTLDRGKPGQAERNS